MEELPNSSTIRTSSLVAALRKVSRPTTTLRLNVQNATNSFTVTSVGGFANVRVVRLLDPDLHILDDLLLGGGVVWTTEYNNHRVDSPRWRLFGTLADLRALQYLIAKQLFVKGVFALRARDFKPSGAVGEDVYSNEMYSFRVRLITCTDQEAAIGEPQRVPRRPARLRPSGGAFGRPESGPATTTCTDSSVSSRASWMRLTKTNSMSLADTLRDVDHVLAVCGQAAPHA